MTKPAYWTKEPQLHGRIEMFGQHPVFRAQSRATLGLVGGTDAVGRMTALLYLLSAKHTAGAE